MKPLTLTLLATLTLLMLISSAPAQTAKVIELSAADAATAKQLHDERIALEDRESKFNQSIIDHYIMEKKPGSGTYTFSSISICSFNSNCPPETPAEKKKRLEFDAADKRTHTHLELRPGWSGMFEYSDDWKFIVPKQTVLNVNTAPSWVNCSGITATPTYNGYILH